MERYICTACSQVIEKGVVHRCAGTVATDAAIQQVEKREGGTKYDGDKPIMAYLPPYAIGQMAQVMTFGAKKYGGFNYLGGISYTRLISAGLRHTFSYLRGENLDPESGLPHWAHALACFAMLGEMTHVHPELDDRFAYPAKEEK